MAKDPAFLFYSSDFLTGVLVMDFEDRGKYITILSLMHQQGRLSEKTIWFLVGSVSDSLKLKFKIDENGLWYNERLEAETQKRQKYVESRNLNGKKGGRPKKVKNSEPYAKPTQNHMDNHMGNHMENENENENRIEDELFVKTEKPKNGKAKKSSEPAAKILPHTFRNSEYFDIQKLEVALCGTNYETANVPYYYECLLNWSDSKGEKKLDWLATAKNWIVRDIKENKFVNKDFNPQNVTNGNHANGTSTPGSKTAARDITKQSLFSSINQKFGED